jgi:hypothetical protein
MRQFKVHGLGSGLNQGCVNAERLLAAKLKICASVMASDNAICAGCVRIPIYFTGLRYTKANIQQCHSFDYF